MSAIRILVPTILLAATAAFPARAQEPEEEDEAADGDTGPSQDDEGEPDDEEEDNPGHSHFGQFGLRAGLVAGIRMYFRYDESPLCQVPEPGTVEDDQNSVCGFVSPFATELALSFAPLGSVEPYLWTRLGLTKEEKTNTDPLVLIGAGVRLYTVSDKRWKLFIEPAVAWELEGGGNDSRFELPGFEADYKKDIIFHLGIGPQFDVAEHFGIFFNAGMDVGILRAIHANLLGNLGIQGRVP